MTGIVVKTTGSQYQVESGGKRYTCRIKGTFKLKGIDSTNPLAVGDLVHFDEPMPDGIALIHTIEERKNYIIRKSVKLSRQSQILACNLDAAALVVTPLLPRTSTGFIDRFLATAEAYHIPAFLVFNKVDLRKQADFNVLLEELLGIYQPLNYTCIQVSATTGFQLDQLRSLLKDKITLLAGHSGVGKSSLINTLDPALSLKIAAISQQHEKGVHTTTFAEMFPLSFGGYIVDTPGIGEFGTYAFNKEEIAHYFREMVPLLPGCKFNNCLHEHEVHCAVKAAVSEGKIHPSRYHNYLSILHNEDIFR